MKALSFLVFLFSIASTQAAVNGPCTGSGLTTGTGVCISTSKCTAKGGTVNNGLCPDNPDDIKCCTKAPCTNASLGGCVFRFTSSCTGNNRTLDSGFPSSSDLCPGPTNFKCYTAPYVPDKRDEESCELEKRIPVC
ncbi:putative d-alanyl-d-alanine carboxypeptidase protein [Mycena venus]|uniref:Putative d-alanyl-d-alanine carboxypeptidase protein n=1 Tax=Mycena venus TaxID=2733690 RepID=A0A8H7CVM6_9AGAR|nr:putative d-alanyl-d-alanine carboxypeptidase protein [Mycena venus]